MAQQTEVLFFFDTEDYTDSRSADAIVNLARICREEDVIGHFALVGLLARQLIAWKRWDVLEALSGHEIGTHSYGHSLHPNLCELTDLKDYDAAYSALRQQETAADLNLNTFLPPQIRVDGQWLGPADFLFAGLEALCCSCDSIDLIPRPQLNSLDQYPHLASFRLKGTWLHSPDLADCYLSDRLRLQAWTLRRR